MLESLFNKVAGRRPKACNFIKKETLAQVFSSEFCEISKNTFLHRTPLMDAFVFKKVLLIMTFNIKNFCGAFCTSQPRIEKEMKIYWVSIFSFTD